MNIDYKSRKLRKICEDPSNAQKEYGKQIGNKITQRVGELIAADCLDDISKIPAAELHSLEGTRSNQFAVTLVQPFRLVFSAVSEDKVSITSLKEIKIIRIEEVVNYHGKQKKK
jgi:proteic killer suppression protein